MHWLRDLMKESPLPISSLGELARRALAHPAWPPDARPQARSLAALLSKLDRGQELDWLGDRPGVQRVLSDVLQTPPSRIAEAVGDGLARVDAHQGRIRFADIPLASPLDLTGEALPPGIPDRVLRPREWKAIWWVAPRGSGRSLSGAWLSARGLSSFVSASDWGSARAMLPDSGAVFVELRGPEAERAALPARDGICVAAPFRPSGESARAWTIVESEPPATWLGPLVEWLARRLPRDGHFEPKSALAWLKYANDEGLVDGLGSAIGLGGLLDEHGVQDTERLGIARVAERFVRQRLATGGRTDETDTAWLEKNGLRIVLGLVKRRLTSGEHRWDAPCTESEWIALIPDEYRNSVDAEWVRLSLGRTAGPRTVKDIERALRDLPPGAFRVVRALSRAGILRGEGPGDALVLGPAWLAHWAHRQARQAIVGGGPDEWGEALLSPDSGWVARGIIERVSEGDPSVLEDVLDMENAKEPSGIAAFELAFRAAGVALLAGVDVPNDTRAALFEHQLSLVVERHDGPHPRIEYDAEARAEEPLLDVGVFRLAALAISEALTSPRHGGHALLNPWKHPRPSLLGPLLGSAWNALSRFDLRTTRFAGGAFELADRLRRVTTENGARPADEHLALEWPAELLRRVADGTVGWPFVRTGGDRLLEATMALAALRNLETRAVLRSLWVVWAAAPEPLRSGSPFAPDSVDSKAIYAAAPPEALTTLFAGGLIDVRAVPYDVFDASQWYAIVHASPNALRGARAAFRAMPREIARDLVLGQALGAEECAAVWASDPILALDALVDAIVVDMDRALVLLGAAQGTEIATILEKLSELRALLPEALKHDALRAWLHDCVARRAPGFRTALSLLDENP